MFEKNKDRREEAKDRREARRQDKMRKRLYGASAAQAKERHEAALREAARREVEQKAAADLLRQTEEESSQEARLKKLREATLKADLERKKLDLQTAPDSLFNSFKASLFRTFKPEEGYGIGLVTENLSQPSIGREIYKVTLSFQRPESMQNSLYKMQIEKNSDANSYPQYTVDWKGRLASFPSVAELMNYIVHRLEKGD